MSEKFRDKYRIPSTRLQNWDYSENGYYFITICTKERRYYFGEIINNKIQLSEIGKIIQHYWLEIPKHFLFVKLDEFAIMPNHVHGILIIKNNNCIVPNIDPNVETRQCLVSTTDVMAATDSSMDMNKKNRFQNQGKHTISSIVGSYKSICAKIINKTQKNTFFRWQSRFYDRIIRNEKSFYYVRKYIRNNPINWGNDRNNLRNN